MPARPAVATTRPTASCRRCSTARSTRCSTASRRRRTIRPQRCCRSQCSIPPAAPATSCWRAARRIATRLARARAGGVASPADYRHALRDVARACIHGVDRNPMAVELTKVALWIETVEPGKPLGFLDANIRCGDSLLGVFDLKALEEGIPDAAYKPLSGDDKETAKHFEKRNKDGARRSGQPRLRSWRRDVCRPPLPMAGEARALRAMPEDSPEEIAAKRKRFEAARADPRPLEPAHRGRSLRRGVPDAEDRRRAGQIATR